MTSSTSNSERPAPARPGPLHLLAAVVGPLVLVASGLWLISGSGEQQEKSDTVVELEAALEAADPEVLLVGNSLVGVGVDTEALSKALGGKRVHTLWTTGSLAPHWYAMLENRVYANGRVPPVVVIANTLRRTTTLRVGGARLQADLAENMSDFEPVLGAKVFGRKTASGSSAWDRLKARRTALNRAQRDGLKGRAVGLFWDGPGEGSRNARAQALADEALGRVFDPENAIDIDLLERVVPIVEVDLDRPKRGDKENAVADSLLPDLIDLAQENGSRIVFVWMPVSDRAQELEAVPIEDRREAIRLITEKGAGLIDLSEMKLEPSNFRDLNHLSKSGSAIFTAALAMEFDKIGIFEEQMRAPRVPLTHSDPPVAHRIGTLPPPEPVEVRQREDTPCGWRTRTPLGALLGDRALESLGFGRSSPLTLFEDGVALRPFAFRSQHTDACSGAFSVPAEVVVFSPSGADPAAAATRVYTLGLAPDLPLTAPEGERWWLYPGTGFEIALAGGWATLEGDTIGLDLSALALGEEAGGFDISVNGAAPVRLEAAGALREAHLELANPHAPWTIRLTATADAPYLLLSSLSLAHGDETENVVGRGDAPTEIVADLLGTDRPQPDLKDKLPPLPAVKVVEQSPGVGRITVPELAMLADDTVRDATLARNCSPIRVSWKGTILPGESTSCVAVREEGGGKFCHHSEVLWVSTPDGAPLDEGAWALALDPEHHCSHGWWLYPGTTLASRGEAKALQLMSAGANRLHLEGWLAGAAPEAVQVRIEADGTTHTRAQVLPEQWTREGLELVIEPPLPPDTEEVVLVLENPGADTWLLLSAAELREVRD